MPNQPTFQDRLNPILDAFVAFGAIVDEAVINDLSQLIWEASQAATNSDAHTALTRALEPVSNLANHVDEQGLDSESCWNGGRLKEIALLIERVLEQETSRPGSMSPLQQRILDLLKENEDGLLIAAIAEKVERTPEQTLYVARSMFMAGLVGYKQTPDGYIWKLRSARP
jgi:hypothetical protein